MYSKIHYTHNIIHLKKKKKIGKMFDLDKPKYKYSVHENCKIRVHICKK